MRMYYLIKIKIIQRKKECNLIKKYKLLGYIKNKCNLIY